MHILIILTIKHYSFYQTLSQTIHLTIADDISSINLLFISQLQRCVQIFFILFVIH